VAVSYKGNRRPRLFTELFLSYGAGQHYLQGFTRARAWNLICWILIVLGSFGWVVFLMWKPY
jgi:hypothetical protein